jgi:TMEM175 potassium channel family protein
VVDRQESGGAPPEAKNSALEVEKIGLERAVFFSDAVIAIAMTLLALDLEVPRGESNAEIWRNLREHWHNSYFPFLLSFVVIASFWFSHHQFFGKLNRLAGRMIQLNMVFLLMMVLLPFVTRVLGTSGDFTIGPVLYAAVLSTTCFTMAAIGISAIRNDALRPGITDVRDMVIGIIGTGVVFLVSIPIAFWNVSVAEWSWLALSVLVHRIPRRWTRPRTAS